MLLIPAIAFKDGKCEGAGVTPGNGPAPAEALRIAEFWVTGGARRLHVADADLPGKRTGVDVIRRLAEAHPEISIQAAGNFRDGDDVGRYLEAGAEYVVLEPKAAGAAHFINDLCLEYPGHVLLTMEARGALGSRSKLARQPPEEAARRFQQEGIAGIVYRASADGAGAPDVVPAVELAGLLTVPVLICAGSGSFDALSRICNAGAGLAGVILDAAYRDATRGPAEAVQFAEQVSAAE